MALKGFFEWDTSLHTLSITLCATQCWSCTMRLSTCNTCSWIYAHYVYNRACALWTTTRQLHCTTCTTPPGVGLQK